MTENTVPPQASTDPESKGPPRGDETAKQALPNPPAPDNGSGNERDDKKKHHQPHQG